MTAGIRAVEAELNYQWQPWETLHAQLLNDYAAALPADRAGYWLDATARFMAPPDRVYCHYLTDSHNTIIVMLPLIHKDGHPGACATSLSSFYSSLSGSYGCTHPEYLCQLLERILTQWQFNYIDCQPLAEDDALMQIAYRQLTKGTVGYFRFDNYYQLIDSDYQAYLQQRPAILRQTLQRKQKQLARLNAQCKIFHTVADIRQHLQSFHQVYRQSWKQNEYSRDFIDEVCLAAAQLNEVRLGIVWLEHEPIAAQIWFVRAGIANIFKLAYHSAYQKLSPGTVLSAAMFRQVIDIDKVDCIDYGIGSEAYKADWMSCKRQRYGIMLFNLKRFNGFLLWCRHRLPALLRLRWRMPG